MTGLRLVLFVAVRQLWHRKLLNGIAALGVALGVTTLLAMNGIMAGFQERFKSEIVRVSPHVTVYDTELGTERGILETLLGHEVVAAVSHEQPSDRVTRIERPGDLVAAIEAMPEVAAACAGLVGQAIVTLGRQDLGVDMRGVVARTQARCTPMPGYMLRGSWRELDVIADGIVMGIGVAEELGAEVGDRVRIVAPGGRPVLLTVLGIFEAELPSIDRSRVYVGLDTAQEVLRRPNTIGRVEVRLHDPWQARAVTDRIEALAGYDAESWLERNANFLALFDTQNVIVRMVIAAILVVGGFGVLAVQIMIVLEKSRDIAILRAVGARRADVLRVFLLQGLLVSLVGAALGDLAGWRLVAFLGTLEIESEGIIKSSTLLVYEDPVFYLYGVVFAVLVGTSASVLPAWHGSRLEPVQVLRGQLG